MTLWTDTNYRKVRKIKLPDAIILATASKLQADLITYNPSDFAGIDESVNIIVPNLNQ